MDKHVHDRIKLFPKRKLTSTPRLALAIANSCNFLNNMNIEKIKDYRRCCCSIAVAWDCFLSHHPLAVEIVGWICHIVDILLYSIQSVLGFSR